jgi:DNA repair exonuclease SbcCD ATPase subunit
MINFQTVSWKNFLSTGASGTEIKLDKSPNTLIIGHNGAGKSTVLDALCFGLFGKPFRKINKPQLLNSINTSDCVVNVEFSIGTKQYKVIRGIKPNLFEIYCNGNLVNQDAKAKDYQEHLEKFILKLNYKSFTQVVILGSASFVPFMQLSPGDRRAIIEDLLDIQIFSSMNSVVKDKMAEFKEELSKVKYAISLAQEKINLQKQNIEEHKLANEEEVQRKRDEIETNQSQLEQLTLDNEKIQKHIDILSKQIGNEKTSLEAKSKKLLQLETKVENNIKKNEKDVTFYESNDNCPTCKHPLEESFKQLQITERKEKLTQQKTGLKEIENEIQKLSERMAEIASVIDNVSKHNSQIVANNSTITSIRKYIDKLNREIKELSSKKMNLEEDNKKLIELKAELVELNTTHESLSTERMYYDFAANLLKDTGIKTKIIKQYLPIMNKLINKYLTAMDFFVNFNIDENFNETIKSRHRDEFSYANFSEGEKMRIDLALLFTWRQIAKLKNSTNTNLLILDEVFDSSLDTVGTEEFLKLIHEMGTDTNIFVISHKGDQLFDKFRSVIKFEKYNNFSRIAK